METGQYPGLSIGSKKIVNRLIHMNGRIYDPKMGRMLSPDPVTQAPENGQNYNRYTYAYNNPLKYTDPSGYEVNTKLVLEETMAQLWPDISSNGGGYGNGPQILASTGNSSATTQVGRDVITNMVDQAAVLQLEQEVQSGTIIGKTADGDLVDGNGNVIAQLEYIAGSQQFFETYSELQNYLKPGDLLFGKRPLNVLLLEYLPVVVFQALMSDVLNVELLHEQVFFLDTDGQVMDIGFFNSSDGGRIGRDPGFPANIQSYRFGRVYRDQDIGSMNFVPRGFGPGKYDLIRNNCQHFCNAIRTQLQ